MTPSFTQLGLRAELLHTLARLGYETPTPIQSQAIPVALEGGDVLGLAQTGTGKTAAFLLPILQKLCATQEMPKPHCPRALVLAPTRELALQIATSLRDYGQGLKIRHSVVVGGVSQQRQADDLRRGVDILIATPGRLIDLMEQGIARLSAVETLVLDEADRMLEIGFLPAIRRIVSAVPKSRQTLFFSATMPKAVVGLANDMLRNPVRVEVVPESTPVERIDQSVIHAPAQEKRQILLDLMADNALYRVIVFTRTKHGADKVAKLLDKMGISTGAMHGRKSQNQRQAVLRAFSGGKIRVLVATDIAARGIDVDDVSHVINYELPYEPESYVHRIGRTARAGKTGVAIALCDHEEKGQLKQIEKQMRRSIRVVGRPPASGMVVPPPQAQPEHRGNRPEGARRQQQPANRNAPSRNNNNKRGRRFAGRKSA